MYCLIVFLIGICRHSVHNFILLILLDGNISKMLIFSQSLIIRKSESVSLSLHLRPCDYQLTLQCLTLNLLNKHLCKKKNYLFLIIPREGLIFVRRSINTILLSYYIMIIIFFFFTVKDYKLDWNDQLIMTSKIVKFPHNAITHLDSVQWSSNSVGKLLI